MKEQELFNKKYGLYNFQKDNITLKVKDHDIVFTKECHYTAFNFGRVSPRVMVDIYTGTEVIGGIVENYMEHDKKGKDLLIDFIKSFQKLHIQLKCCITKIVLC